ncbi:MAG TPA: extracellular solute-binding protein, partial [Acidimicrobiales bacterium]|nr:extracellular solute-binding protein [Acidimicrobiales bacterium]
MAALALAGGTLTACGANGGSAITLYNGQHPQLTQALVNAFEEQTGITVRVRTDDGIVLADEILQEGSSSPADVYLTENSPELMMLQGRGLLSPLPSSVLSQVPPADSSPVSRWVGVALRVGALAYDPARVTGSALPARVLDLAQPRWKGKVAVAPTDSDFVPLVGAVLATYGKAQALAWLQGLKANASVFQDDEAVVAAVNRGQAAVGLVNQYYWYRLRLEEGAAAMHSRLWLFPHRDVGSIENISGAAVLASSSHKTSARKFVDFLVSARAQRILADGDDFEYPARPGIDPNPALPALAKVNPAV